MPHLSPPAESLGVLHALRETLSEEAVQELLTLCEEVELDAGQVVAKADEPVQALYIVKFGRLGALAGEGELEREWLRGDILGHVELMTGAGWAGDLTALRASTVLRLSREGFDRLAREQPETGLALTRMAVIEASTPRPPCPTALSIAVLPLHGGNGAFPRRLHEALSLLGSSRLVEPGQFDGARDSAQAVSRFLGPLDFDTTFVVMDCSPDEPTWTEACLLQADRLLLLADFEQDPALSPREIAILDDPMLERLRPELVLLRGEGLPRDTRRWLDLRPHLACHHHLRRGKDEDTQRLARLLSGHGFGLALGGGGSRAVAHVGVIRALIEAGVPIDIVSGTSAGAAVGAMVALGWSPEEMLEGAISILGRFAGHVWSGGPPVCSLMSGSYVVEILERVFEDLRLEDLPLPMSIVSTDLNSGEPYYHRRGTLVHTIRSSAAIPGLWPPVCHEGRLLVDGGYVENLPVSQLLQTCGHGATIASDLTVREVIGPCPDTNAINGWRALGAWMTGRPLPAPLVTDVLGRASTIGSRVSADRALKTQVDLVFKPPVGDIKLFEVRTARQVRQVERKGYEHARGRVEAWWPGDWLDYLKHPRATLPPRRRVQPQS